MLGYRTERDAVDVHATRFIRGDNLATEFQKFRDAHSDEDFCIISNRVAMMENTMTHAHDRGSNNLIGKNIVQPMTWVTPEQFDALDLEKASDGSSKIMG